MESFFIYDDLSIDQAKEGFVVNAKIMMRAVHFVMIFLFLSLLWVNCSSQTPVADGTSSPDASSTQDSSTITDNPPQDQNQTTPDISAPVDNNTNPDKSTPADKGKTSAYTYHKHIRPLIEQRCLHCHKKGGIGPFELTEYKKIHGLRHAIKQAVVTRKMPPWSATRTCSEYKDDFSLTDQEIKMVSDWVEAGAPEGKAEDFKPREKKFKVGIDRVDLSLKMPKPYKPLKNPDDYRCFVIPWTKKKTTYVTGFQIKAGQPAIVHHVIAYLIEKKDAAKYLKKEEADKHPGYECFGGPGGNGSWLGAWAPGLPGGNYPKNTGIRVEPGSLIVLQLHYNVLQSNPAPDQTAIELQLADNVPLRGRLIPLADPKWTRGNGMPIPAGKKDVKHSTELSIKLPIAITIHNVGLHMHLLGKSGHMYLKKKDGSKVCLLNIPRWDFDWQIMYSLNKTVKFEPGDSIGLSCTWDNTPEKQPTKDGKKLPPRDVKWGDGSTDEMCLGVVYISHPNF